MNFGVVFAFILSLPLARMEVSFRRGQRAVLPSCQPRAGRAPAAAAPARRCGGRSRGRPGSGAEPGARSRGRGPGPAPRVGLRREPAALMAGSDRRPSGGQRPLERAHPWSGHPSGANTPSGAGTLLWSEHPSGAGTPWSGHFRRDRPAKGGSPGNPPTPVSAPGCRGRGDKAEAVNVGAGDAAGEPRGTRSFLPCLAQGCHPGAGALLPASHPTP